jgi:hypothetical protein
MTGEQLRLLKDIAGGRLIFRCASRSPRELGEFERVADELLRLEALGYVGRCVAEVETETGRRYVNRVRVLGGLTPAGAEALAKAAPD